MGNQVSFSRKLQCRPNVIDTDQIMELAERFHMQVAMLNCAKGAVEALQSFHWNVRGYCKLPRKARGDRAK
jgi:hypothetical protein